MDSNDLDTGSRDPGWVSDNDSSDDDSIIGSNSSVNNNNNNNNFDILENNSERSSYSGDDDETFNDVIIYTLDELLEIGLEAVGYSKIQIKRAKNNQLIWNNL